MSVQIGTLVLRAQFGSEKTQEREDPRDKLSELDVFRRAILNEVEDMMAQAERRARER